MWQICFLNHKLTLTFLLIATFSPLKCSDLNVRKRAVLFKFIFMLLLSSHEPGSRDLALTLSFDVFITRGGGGGVGAWLSSQDLGKRVGYFAT